MLRLIREETQERLPREKPMNELYFKAGLTVGIAIGIPLGIASGIFLGTLMTRLIEHSDWEKALKKHREELRQPD